MKISINEKTVKGLKPPNAGNIIHYDREVRGFGVRITANGAVNCTGQMTGGVGAETLWPVRPSRGSTNVFPSLALSASTP